MSLLYKTLGPITFLFESKNAQIFSTRTHYLIQLKSMFIQSNSYQCTSLIKSNLISIQSLINRYNQYYRKQILSLYSEHGKPPSILINHQIGIFLQEQKNNQYKQRKMSNEKSQQNYCFVDLCKTILNSLQIIGYQYLANGLEIEKSMFFMLSGQNKTKGFYLYLPTYNFDKQLSAINKKECQKNLCININNFLQKNFGQNAELSNKLLMSKLKKSMTLCQMRQQIQYFTKIYETGLQKIKVDNKRQIQAQQNAQKVNKKNGHRTYRKRSQYVYLQKQNQPSFSYENFLKKQSSSQYKPNTKKSINLHQIHKNNHSNSAHSLRNKSYATKLSLFPNKNKSSKALHNNSKTFGLGFGTSTTRWQMMNNYSKNKIDQLINNNTKLSKQKQIEKKHINNFMHNFNTSSGLINNNFNESNTKIIKHEKLISQKDEQNIQYPQNLFRANKNKEETKMQVSHNQFYTDSQLNEKLKLNLNAQINQQINNNLNKFKDNRMKSNNLHFRMEKQNKQQNGNINVTEVPKQENRKSTHKIKRLDSQQIKKINQSILFQTIKRNQLQEQKQIGFSSNNIIKNKLSQQKNQKKDLKNQSKPVQKEEQIQQIRLQIKSTTNKQKEINRRTIQVYQNIDSQQQTIRVNLNNNHRNSSNLQNSEERRSSNNNSNNLIPYHVQTRNSKKKVSMENVGCLGIRNSIRDSEQTSRDGDNDKPKCIKQTLQKQKDKTSRKKGSVPEILSKNILTKAKNNLQRINCIGQCVTKTPNFMSTLDSTEKFLWQLPAFILYKQFYMQRMLLEQNFKQQTLNLKSQKQNLLKFLNQVHEQNAQAIDSLSKLLKATIKKLKKYKIDESNVKQSKNYLNLDFTIKWSARTEQIIYTYIKQLEDMRQQKKQNQSQENHQINQKLNNIMSYQVQVIDALLIIKGVQIDLEQKKKVHSTNDKDKIMVYFQKRKLQLAKLLKK